MKQMLKILTAALILMFFFAVNSAAQKHSKTVESRYKVKNSMQINCDSTMIENSGKIILNSKNREKYSDRTDVISPKFISQNIDAKMYKNTMDLNIVLDKPDRCPKCEMELKGVSDYKAKQNSENP